jgi:hypothetical protein
MPQLTPTAEQQAIIDAYRTGQNLVIEAGAGTGKTSTLKMLAAAAPDRSGFYIAYNRAIAKDAGRSFPGNIECRTAHSLAFRAVGSQFKARLDGPRQPARIVAQLLRINPLRVDESLMLSPTQVARVVNDTVANFCRSADAEIAWRHVPKIAGIDLPEPRGRLCGAVAGVAAGLPGRAARPPRAVRRWRAPGAAAGVGRGRRGGAAPGRPGRCGRMIAIGIDPGSRWVAVAVLDLSARDTDGLLAWELWHRSRQESPEELPPFDWLNLPPSAVIGLRRFHSGALVAIEDADVLLPWANGRQHNVRVHEVAGLHRAHAYLVGRLAPVVQVPQRGARNGQGPDCTYPAALRKGIRGSWTKQNLGHVRSAYDVGRKAPIFARWEGVSA